MFKFFCFIFIIGHSFIFCLSRCEVYFSPQDHLAERLVRLIEKEEKSIRVAIYSITHAKIARALGQAKERGVLVEIIVDPTSSKSKSPLHRLAKNQVPLYVWDPPATILGKSGKAKKGLMHDKFCIFGAHTVWTGSFNFTYDAESRNEENVVVLDAPEIAKKYLEHFEEIKVRQCRPFVEYLSLYPKKKSRKNTPLAYTVK